MTPEWLEAAQEREEEIEAIANLEPEALRKKIEGLLRDQDMLYQNPVHDAAEDLNRYGNGPEPFIIDILRILGSLNDDMKHVRLSSFILEHKEAIVKLIDTAYDEYRKDWT